MRSRETSLLAPLGELLSTNLKELLIALGAVLVFGLILYGHSKILNDLRYALASASAQLSPLLVAYDTTGEFNGREVLELTTPEIQRAVESWPTFHTTIYLQVFNIPEKVLFDSRQGKIRSYKNLEPVSSRIQYGSWEREEPFLYVDWNPTLEARWVLRAAVTAPSYFVAHAWRLSLFVLMLSAIGRLALIQIEVGRRRRFDSLVGSMPALLRQAQAEETLIHEVPHVVAHMLDFDSVAIYILEGDHVVPKGYFSKGAEDRSAFMKSPDEGQILIQADEPESRAIRENRPLIVHSPQTGGAFRPLRGDAAASRPYVIVPLRLGGNRLPVGLLTAQRHAGLHEEHKDFLESCAEIIGLLLDNVRSREALERIYRKMIRKTRTETLGTVVPFITHNMRTPLVVVEGLAESISNDFESLNQSDLEERISEIKAQTSLCFQLIRSISEYHVLGNSPARTVNIRRGLEKVCSFFSGYFRIKNIDLEQRYQNGLEPRVRMEELDFVQVITNLLINSDDAFSEMRQRNDEHIGHMDQRIEVVLEIEGDGARISIIDNGPGIRPENLSRVFEQEFTTKDLGTGVGLPYCRKVVEEAGGTIQVKSSYGEGTTVSILLPPVNGEIGL